MDDEESKAQSNEEIDAAVESITKIIDGMAAHLIDYPGFMWTGGGFEVLHADWPAYPSGHGLRNALATLADFPSETKFFPIDNIDQCTLFVVGEVPRGQEHDEKRYHIALWNEGIIELANRDFINDVLVADKQFEFAFLDYPDGYISLTYQGENAILVYELAFNIHPAIIERVEDFLFSHHYDTAVREATILLEMRMRQAVKSEKIGQDLIDECFGERGKLFPPIMPNPARLEIRAVFRRLFKYVRNEFAHNLNPSTFKSLDLVATTRLLRRCSELAKVLETLEKMASSDKSQSKTISDRRTP